MSDNTTIPEMPSEAAILLAHDALHPEDGGDHLPVKLASARSSPDTIALAKRLDAFRQAGLAAKDSDRESGVIPEERLVSRALDAAARTYPNRDSEHCKALARTIYCALVDEVNAERERIGKLLAEVKWTRTTAAAQCLELGWWLSDEDGRKLRALSDHLTAGDGT